MQNVDVDRKSDDLLQFPRHWARENLGASVQPSGAIGKGVGFVKSSDNYVTTLKRAMPLLLDPLGRQQGDEVVNKSIVWWQEAVLGHRFSA